MTFRSSARSGSLLLALMLVCVSTGASAQDKEAAATRQYNAAVGLQNSEAYDLAAEEWIKFLDNFQTDPRIDRARHYLGVCYLKENKLEAAAKTFERLVKDFPKFELLADTYLNLGLAQYNIAHAGKPELYDAAATTFQTLAAKYPEGKHVAEAIFYEGECLYNRGKKKEAAAKYGQMVTQHAKHPLAARALFALGVAQADLGDHTTALQTYDRFLKRFPEDRLVAEARMWRGESLFASKQYAEAIKAYAAGAAAKGFAMADYATLRQADALTALGQHGEAAAVYASVPVKFPKSQYAPLCHLEAGKRYYEAGDFPKSRESLEKVIAAGGPSATEAAHWVARGLLKERKPAAALAVVEKILPQAGQQAYAAQLLLDQADAAYEIPERRGESVALYAALASKRPGDPAAPQALYMAAFAAMNEGDYEAALSHADAFLTAYADHELRVGVVHVTAESNLLLNKFAKAERLYTELLQKWPEDPDGEIWKVHRGTAMYLQKKYQDAIAALEPVTAELKTPELLAEAWYRIGRSQAALEQFGAAAKSLEASLAAAPQWKLADDTHLVLAYAYQQTKNFDQAKQNAQKVIAQFPKGKLLDMAHYRLGECSRLGGDLETAVSEYQQIIKNWPQSSLMPQAFYGLGWARVGQEDYAGAEEAFSALVEKYPEDKLVPRARYGRGMARRQLKKYAAAIEDLQALLAADATPAEKSRARHVLGLCRKGLKRFDQAAAAFQELLKQDPGYADADDVYFELAWAQKSHKREAEAAATFALLAEKYPESPLAADSHYLAGDFAYEKKDYRKAARAYYAALNKAGKTKLGEKAAYKLGLAYYLQDDLKRARQMFDYQRHTWPEDPLASDAALMAAECLFKEKQYEEALAAYELVKNPSNEDAKVQALLHAGNAAGQLKQWEKSLELLSACIEQFPDSPHLPQALYEQGWAQQNLGRPDQAMATYAQVIAKSNGEPAARAQFMIGEIQFEQKKHAQAIKSFFKVSYGYGYPKWQADATYEAARCFEVLEKRPQALKQYQKLVEEYPESDKVPLAKERIKGLQ